MADVTATQITLDSSLEQFKEQFNNLQSDVGGITLTSLGGGNSIVFEGSTADDNETTLSVVDPTGDRTVLLPNASTTLVGTDTTDTLTNKTLTTPVVNAGLQLKNGATSAGFLEFFEDSDNGTNKVTLIGPASTADVTLTLPAVTDTVAGIAATQTLTNKTLTTPTLTTPIANAGIQLKNGATSAGFLEFFEDSDNGTNKVTLIGPAATADVTITLPSTAGTVALTGTSLTIPDGGTIGSASDTDAISISSGGVVAVSATTANTNASDGALTVAGGLGVALDASIGDDLRMISDAAVVSFGANSEITLTHVHDTGLNLKHTATGDDKPIILTLQTGETDIAANDVIGAINFQAPDEASATGDNKLVAAGIEAVSEGDFSNTSNATKLSFKTGASEAAAEKMSLSSAGLLTIADDLIIKDGGTIGVASKADAITIASDGDTVIAGGLGISGNTEPLATGISLGDPANVVIRTHAASGKGNVIIGDATATSSHSLDVRGTANVGALTASGLAFPTSDGSANEVLKTDGSGTLSFTAISSNAITSGDTVVNAIDPNITFVTNGAEEARITAAGNLVLGSTTATHLLDVRGTANTGVLTASGLTFPSSDGSANQAMVTDGSGALSFATVLTSSDPATVLASTPDLGSVASGGSQDAFGQNLGGLTELDLLDEPSGSLSTLDAGALS